MTIKKIFLLILLISQFSTQAFANNCDEKWENILDKYSNLGEYESLVGLCENEFKSALRDVIKTNIDLGYTDARHYMFGEIDNVDGVVCGAYIGKCLSTRGIPNHTIMNCEHSWPQSRGAVGIAKSDIHHLFPSDSKVNSRRSNHPFCVVTEVRWSEAGSAYGVDKDGSRCFEPRDQHKGDVARAMLYFSMRYQKRIDSKQEGFFKQWIIEDRISDKEIKRNNMIEDVQHNRNPFIDIPEFVGLISDF